MTIPNGTGASWFELGNGTAGTNLTLIDPSSVPNTSWLANSFTYRPRGPQSSEGWFLTIRHDLERLYPGLLPDSLLSTAEQSTHKDDGWNRQSIILKIKNKPASFGNVDNSLETDLELTRLYLESAYVLPEYSSGVPANYTRPSLAQSRPNFTDQETEHKNSWDMQLCLVHVVDFRWYLQKGSKPSTLEHLLPRPFLLSGESFTGEDNIHYGSNLNHTSYYGPAPELGYPNLFDSGRLVDETNLFSLTTRAEFPPYCRNLNLVGLDSYRCYWQILNEISHTRIHSLFEDTISEIVPKGLVDDTTANERSQFKSLNMLHQATHDMTPKKGAMVYEVMFPHEGGNGSAWGKIGVEGGSYLPRNSSNQYLTLTIIMGSGVDNYDTNTYYCDAMDSLYGTNKKPYSGPLDGSTKLKGRLFAREDNSNWPEILDHAKQLATLRAKEFHYQNDDKNFFNETYLGLLNFTPTKDLSAIIWSDTGSGATTRIVNRSFDEDHKVYSEPTYVVHPGEVEPINIDEFPPDNFYSDFRHIGFVLSKEDNRKDFYLPDEVFVSELQLDSIASDFRLTGEVSTSNTVGHTFIDVTNYSDYPIFNSLPIPKITGNNYELDKTTVVEIFWNRRRKQWETYTSPYTLAGVCDSTVNSMVGNTVGMGTMRIYYVKNDQWTTTNWPVDFVNISPQTLAIGAKITIKRLGQSGKWVVDMEACES